MMERVRPKNFVQTGKGKIIIAFLLACAALLLAWGVSKVAFKQVQTSVDNISAPNDKLRLVNELSLKIPGLDELQRAQALQSPTRYDHYFKESRKVGLCIDTLKQLYAGDSIQLGRIGHLKKLLGEHDRLFADYLKVREGLVNDAEFSAQVRSMDDLTNTEPSPTDSTVIHSERKTSTTTIYPAGANPPKEKSPGFFRKLFGKKKAYSNNAPYQVVNEEFHTKIDTITKAAPDSTKQHLGETMRNMESSRRRKNELFIAREAELADAGNLLIRQILAILNQVETETLGQAEYNDLQAKAAMNTSVNRINIIVLSFFLLTVVLLYHILMDISRSNRYRKEVELARDEAEYHGRAKQRFLSNMSHEIRTPLQSIIGYAEMIRQQQSAAPKDIDAMYRSSTHLMQIVNEVLDYNRIISGKFTFSNQAFYMEELLVEVVSVMRLQADKKSIKMRTRYAGIAEWGLMEGDPFRLRQILYNLLGNAIKFTDQGSVTLLAEGRPLDGNIECIFTVADTGPGISGPDLNRIFKEFEQAETPAASPVSGTGLGLTICKALVESQGGSIRVESTVGVGSSFIVRLIFARGTVPLPVIEHKMSARADVHSDKVWIIDDDRLILDLCSKIFEHNGILHRCFNAPEEVLRAEWDDAVKYILLDIRMPGMSGMDLCALLRKSVPPQTRIYALTAQVMPEEREAILQHHFDGLLMKPFMENDLLLLLSAVPDPAPAEQCPPASAFALEAPSLAPSTSAAPPVVQAPLASAFALAGPVLEPKTTSPAWDPAWIEKMTFGDKTQMTRILKRFSEDSFNDIAALRHAMEERDYPQTLLLIHRIAGRTAQMGVRELARDFRRAEMDLTLSRQFNQENKESLLSLSRKLGDLVQEINLS